MQSTIRNAISVLLDMSARHLEQVAAIPPNEVECVKLGERQSALATLRTYLAQPEPLDVLTGTCAPCASNEVSVETMEQHVRADDYKILRSDMMGYYFEKDDVASEDHPIRDDAVRAAYEHMNHNATPVSTPGTDDKQEWMPVYSRWRHGGWYVDNVRYPSGACGCVSNNYPDKKWRIACDSRRNELGEPGDYTFASRDAAARAEFALANEVVAQP